MLSIVSFITSTLHVAFCFSVVSAVIIIVPSLFAVIVALEYPVLLFGLLAFILTILSSLVLHVTFLFVALLGM